MPCVVVFFHRSVYHMRVCNRVIVTRYLIINTAQIRLACQLKYMTALIGDISLEQSLSRLVEEVTAHKSLSKRRGLSPGFTYLSKPEESATEPVWRGLTKTSYVLLPKGFDEDDVLQ